MSFQRAKLDIYIPVLAILAGIMLPVSVGSTFTTWRGIEAAKPVPGVVIAINDRAPYSEKKDGYGLEYPFRKVC